MSCGIRLAIRNIKRSLIIRVNEGEALLQIQPTIEQYESYFISLSATYEVLTKQIEKLEVEDEKWISLISGLQGKAEQTEVVIIKQQLKQNPMDIKYYYMMQRQRSVN